MRETMTHKYDSPLDKRATKLGDRATDVNTNDPDTACGVVA